MGASLPRASRVRITDAANYFTGAEVEAALQELGADVGSLASVYQPLDSDLTDIAALSTTSYGRGLLILASQTDLQAAVGVLPALSKGVTYVPSTGVEATDTAALQAAHDNLPAGGGTILLDSGPYILTAGTVNFTKAIHLGGFGPSGASVLNSASYLTSGSLIQCASATGIAIQVNTDGCTFQNLAFQNTAGSTPTAGCAIQITTLGKSTRMLDCTFEKFWNNVEWLYGAEWSITRCVFFNPVNYGILIRNGYNPDAGDGMITDSQFIAGPTNASPVAGIRWESSGEPRIRGCKVNGRTGVKFAVGMDFKIADGATTAGPFIVNCSIENVGIGIDIGQLGTTGVLNGSMIVGCQLGSITTYGIRINGGSSSFVKSVIAANYLSGPTAGVYLAKCSYATLTGNTPVGGSVPQVAWGSGTTLVSWDQTMATQGTLTGTTAGTVVYSSPVQSPFNKRVVFYLNGYRNSTATTQSIFPASPYFFGFGTVARIVFDSAASGATYDTALRLPVSMGAPVTGIIVVEGY